MNARLALLALAATTACSSGARSVGARFSGPVAIVPFAGNLAKAGGGLRDYLAVASSRGDELSILDPSDEQPVLGPNSVFPLSIPTAPRPLRLAAAQLGDRGLGAADLLVAVSAGSLELQVVNTWDPAANAVTPLAGQGAGGTGSSVDLSAALGSDAEILALAAVAGPAADGTPRARLLAAATGGRLAVVDFVREPTSLGVVPVKDAGGNVLVNVKPIGVNALDLAVEPGGNRVFAATRDSLGADAAGNPIFGVQQIDSADDPSVVWPTTPLDAKGPTLAVASARVRESVAASRKAGTPDTFAPAPDATVPLLIYATLDPDGCGTEHEISCGLATLVPSGPPFPGAPAAAGGLADDLAVHPGVVLDSRPVPVDAMRFRAPMPIPGVPVAIAIVSPPASGAARITTDTSNPGIPLMAVAATPGTLNTSAVAAVTSTDGHVYLFDLGRSRPVNELAPIQAASPGGNGLPIVSGAQVVPAALPPPGQTATVLGLSTDFPVVQSANIAADAATLRSLVQVTPGFTVGNDYAITWQGTLPSLVARRASVVVDAGGLAYAAVQLPTGAAPTSDPAGWAVGAQLAAAGAGVVASELGVRVNDFVDVTCPSSAASEVTVAELLAAGSTVQTTAGAIVFPGGAVRLSAVPCSPAQPLTQAVITVRASEVVVTRGPSGQNRAEYVGRPGSFGAQNTPALFAFQWREEHPEAVDPAAAPLDAEALALARRARRAHYPIDPACPADKPVGCFNGFAWLADPLAPGPVVAFKVGLVEIDSAGNAAGASPLGARPARDTQITFTTVTDILQASRRPATAGVLPRGIAAFDRSKFTGHTDEAVRVYATYLDDELLSFTPAEASGLVRSIR